MRKSLQPHQTALLAAVAVAIMGSLVPPVRFLFIPLIYLNTHLHEMSHAIVAMITGGQVVEHEVVVVSQCGVIANPATRLGL